MNVKMLLAGLPEDYPIPPDSPNRLFYLQRSLNSNTIIYDVNLLTNRQFNQKRPVDVYWLRYNTNGEKRALNFAERNFAYGLTFESVDQGKAYMINLMAYAGRVIKVFMTHKGKAVAYIRINGKQARLKSIYIDVGGRGFWSTVNYIELFGEDLESGKPISERFNPNAD